MKRLEHARHGCEDKDAAFSSAAHVLQQIAKSVHAQLQDHGGIGIGLAGEKVHGGLDAIITQQRAGQAEPGPYSLDHTPKFGHL